jgi:4-hydroxybenzoate polyprenyltransferase
LAVALLLAGIACGWLAGYLGLVAGAWRWRSGLIALLLASCVVLYDTILKRTALGPPTMGACRLLNVLLGMAVAAPSAGTHAVLGYGPHHWLAASGIGVYIAGVTWFARSEAQTSRRISLTLATIVITSGLALLALLHRTLPHGFTIWLAEEDYWLLLIGLLALVIVRRCASAVLDPSPQRVQSAVRNAIWSVIVLDAAVGLLVSPPQWSLLILALLLPTVVLGGWIKAT